LVDLLEQSHALPVLVLVLLQVLVLVLLLLRVLVLVLVLVRVLVRVLRLVMVWKRLLLQWRLLLPWQRRLQLRWQHHMQFGRQLQLLRFEAAYHQRLQPPKRWEWWRRGWRLFGSYPLQQTRQWLQRSRLVLVPVWLLQTVPLRVVLV
jgi:hypothetical protein